MSARVIDFARYAEARSRARKVRYLIAGLTKFQAGMGPTDALALSIVARSLTADGWACLDQIAKELARRADDPFTIPSSAITRQLVLDDLEDRAREVRLAAIDVRVSQ